jgi:hypothetical protein
MDRDLVNDIYRNFKKSSTEGLQKIYLEHDYSKWSEEAFEAIKIILKERNEEIPEVDEKIKESQQDIKNYDNTSSEGCQSIFFELFLLPIRGAFGYFAGRFLLSYPIYALFGLIDSIFNNKISVFLNKNFPVSNNPIVKGDTLKGFAILLAMLSCFLLTYPIISLSKYYLQRRKALKNAGDNIEALIKYFMVFNPKKLIRLRKKYLKMDDAAKTKAVDIVIKQKEAEEKINVKLARIAEEDKIFRKNITASNITGGFGSIIAFIGILSPWFGNLILSVSGLHSELLSRYLLYPILLIFILSSIGIFAEKKNSFKLRMNAFSRGIAYLCGLYMVFLFFFQFNVKSPNKGIMLPSLGSGFWITAAGFLIVGISHLFYEKMVLE